MGLVIALVLSAALVRPVLAGWKSPTVGVSLLIAVWPEALAVLAATLAVPERARWLLIVALVPFVLGLGLYALVISRFDLNQLAVGHGDHWITGGALGISALAAATITAGARALGIAGVGGGSLEDIAIGLWALTILWLVALVRVEARWPRPSVGAARWSTVFPLGMYAACSFAVGAVADAGAITSFARVWVWVGLASWAIVFAATVGRAVKVVRGPGRLTPERPPHPLRPRARSHPVEDRRPHGGPLRCSGHFRCRSPGGSNPGSTSAVAGARQI